MSTIHVPLIGAEAATGGTAHARVPLAGVEAATGGTAHARAPLVGLEAATGGNSRARIPLLGVEFLSLVPGPPPGMGTQIFPNLPGLGWSVHKKPNFSTRVATHQGGREIRAAQQQWPVWDFSLTFEVLASNAATPGPGALSLQALMGFFLARQGSFDSFLFQDPTDCQVTGGQIGVADGVTTIFTLSRSLVSPYDTFFEPVGFVFSNQLTGVYVNGVVQATSGYALTEPNTLTFATAPAAGAGTISADFSFYFSVRFTDDVEDFEQFMSDLWLVQELKLKSVLP